MNYIFAFVHRKLKFYDIFILGKCGGDSEPSTSSLID